MRLNNYTQLLKKKKPESIEEIYIDSWSEGFSDINIAKTLSKYNMIDAFYYYGKCLSEFPKELADCKELVRIVFDNREEKTFNISLPSFEKLKKVYDFTLKTDNSVENFNEISALQNLKELTILAPLTNENISSIETLVNLTSLEIYSDTLTKLPSFEKLTKLKKLIINGKKITKIPSFNHLSNLENFGIRGNKIIEIGDFSACSRLSKLSISSKNQTKLPSFTKLKKLKEIELENSCLPIGIFESPVLSDISIVKCPNDKITVKGDLNSIYFEGCNQLTSIEIEGSQLEYLGSVNNPVLKEIIGLENNTNLNSIHLSNSPKLEKLPSFANFPFLNGIHFSSLGIIELPSLTQKSSFEKIELEKLPHITSLDSLNLPLVKGIEDLIILQVPFSDFPNCPKTNIETVRISKYPKDKDKNDLLLSLHPKCSFVGEEYSNNYHNSLGLALGKTTFSLEEKKFFYNKLNLQQNYLNYYSFSRKELLQLTMVSHTKFQKELFLKLEKQAIQDLEKNPLNGSIKIAVLGTTNTKKAEYKELFNAINLTFHTKLQEDTTHIVLGKKIKDYESISDEVTWVTEKDILAFINKQNTPFLLEDDINTQDKDNIRELLEASDEDTVLLGLEMLSKGGVPEELLLDLLLLQKTSAFKKVKTKARKLLIANGTKAHEELVTDRSRFTSTKSERDLTKHLEMWHGKAPSISILDFALKYHKQTQKGLNFIFKYLDYNSPLRNEFLNKFKKGKKIDLNDMLLKDVIYAVDEYYTKYFDAVEEHIPEEVFEMADLESLSLKGFCLEHFPSETLDLINLKKLDLSYNNIKKLPQDISKLVNLEHLILDENELEGIPVELKGLTALKTLSIKGNRESCEYKKFKATDKKELEKVLPQVEIIIR